MDVSVCMKILETFEYFAQHGGYGEFVEDTMFDIHGLHAKLEYVKQTTAVEKTQYEPEFFFDHERRVIRDDIFVVTLTHHLDFFLF